MKSKLFNLINEKQDEEEEEEEGDKIVKVDQ